MYAVDDARTQKDEPRWTAYKTQLTDGFGYDKERWGVREEYPDGATRHIHDEVYATEEEAMQVAARFHLNAKKGKTYDNVMKEWK